MSEQEYFKCELQAIPRLEDETDKEYFERATKCPWQRYDYEPDNIREAIYDNDISYYDFNKSNQDCYICLNNVIYKFVSLDRSDYINSFCHYTNKEENNASFEAYFYNGGTCLEEVLTDAMNKKDK